MSHYKPIEQSFKVSYEYKLHFTENIFSLDNPLFKDIIKGYNKKGDVKVLFVIDSGVLACHPNLSDEITSYCSQNSAVLHLTEKIVITGGEQCKNDYGNVERILNAVNDNRICRHSFVVAIGGGAIIDMVGYAAAIAHRGVKLIRIPTTVLSQNDSAVGVKNSFNILGKKNFLGTFSPAYAIINDSDFLTTLEQRDWISGIAEAVKVALIKDAVFFDFIEDKSALLRARDMESMEYLIYRCAEMHMEHIAQGGDPFESGSSRPLDFGHWAAHKLEYMTNYQLRHGEAVAIGMALDLVYAHFIGLISKETLDRILTVLEQIGFNLHIPIQKDGDLDDLLNGIQEFREHLGGELTITLISKIGAKHDVHEIDISTMEKAIVWLNEMYKPKVSNTIC
ncbi:3-dehydroquinate synthase [Arenibacter sp. M-2]|uniref:3-dehydroquinate synthase n=1 Tax=unclassified Arenibacter TaxID=2615047 RepID=UPI000D76FF21|nr:MULTISPECIES: 3-dehydroquinate synthase [unclassified Arenibacter]MDL5511506.1 3-dehydroquinate synthase [Arenibacter sp. M-2]PXX22671.1 3-dehydroquinate synthase [Arenibacter sp. ARW7G5Y1]|tara:strand:- start:1066 stop:2247 length:1182 start_codon:yes stop_codon:yes gene_type:complete